MKQKIHQCQMLDEWRVQHPRTQDYTFYSPVHRTDSRIDYIMVDHRLLELVTETKLEISTLSHHSPGTMSCKSDLMANYLLGYSLQKRALLPEK